MLRPLPPFRPKPRRLRAAPKQVGEARRDGAPMAAKVTVKAKRHPIKVARLSPAPALKVLSHAEA